MEGKKARSTLPALVRESYEGRKYNFFYRDDDFNELRSEGESGFEKADPRFTWWTSRMTSNTTYGYMTSMKSIVDQAVNSRSRRS
jgi:hypothetical protein